MKYRKMLSVLLAFVMLAALLPAFSLRAMADGSVAISEENFPDELFRNYVESKLDTVHDGHLSDEEIAAVKEIRVREEHLI